MIVTVGGWAACEAFALYLALTHETVLAALAEAGALIESGLLWWHGTGHEGRKAG
jgi:hypothetical protein